MKLIQLFILSLFLFLFSNTASAYKMALTPKLGLGFSFMSGLENVNSKFAYSVGLGYKLRFKNRYEVEIGAIYKEKGSYARRQDYSTSYINFPITGRIRIVEHLTGFFGPQFGVMLAAESNSSDTTAYTETFDFGFVFGFGYYFLNGNDRLLFDFVIDISMVDISKSNHPVTSLHTENRAAYVSFGYEFRL